MLEKKLVFKEKNHSFISILDIGRSPAYYEVYPSHFKSATQK